MGVTEDYRAKLGQSKYLLNIGLHVKLILLQISILKGITNSVLDCETNEGNLKDMRGL